MRYALLFVSNVFLPQPHIRVVDCNSHAFVSRKISWIVNQIKELIVTVTQIELFVS
jgi:hypothetical protein